MVVCAGNERTGCVLDVGGSASKRYSVNWPQQGVCVRVYVLSVGVFGAVVGDGESLGARGERVSDGDR